MSVRKRYLRIVTCGRCGLDKSHAGRGLCSPCRTHEVRAGTLEDWPRVTVALDLVLSEWRHPARAGWSFIEVGVELGLNRRAAERQWYRARQRGLVDA